MLTYYAMDFPAYTLMMPIGGAGENEVLFQ